MKVGREYALHSEDEPARLDRQANVIQIERFLDSIPPAPNGRILDAGCGSASMARLLARTRPDASITGLDISQSYLEYAKRHSTGEGIDNIELIHGSILEMPFPDDHFDVVWTCLVLHWLPAEELDRAMRELVRVIRPGGWLVCAEPDGAATNHYPIETDLLEQWSRVTRGLFVPDMGRRLYPLMYDAGLADIRVDLRPYFFHAFGPIDPDTLEVIVDALRPAMPKIAAILGSDAAASRFLDRIVDQHKNPRTVFFPLWFLVAGQKSV